LGVVGFYHILFFVILIPGKMFAMKRLILLLFTVTFLASCKPAVKVSFQGEAQGTYYAVTYFDSDGRDLQIQVDSILKAFDQTASVWEKNSIISKINRNDTDVVLDQYFIDIFQQSHEVSKNTDGAFDITVGPLIRAWGFWFKEEKRNVDQKLIDSIMPLIGYQKVKLENGQLIKKLPGIQLDYNAIAQGYSVDLVARFLESKGIKRYLIDIGGEVLAHGRKPGYEQWKVGIEKPTGSAMDERMLQATVFLNNKALATSGNYRKFYVKDGIKYSHTIDPRTGYPVQHSLLSASVIADDCSTADAYATAFMVMGLEKSKLWLEEHKDFEVFLIYADEDGSFKNYLTPGMRRIIYK